MKRDRPELPPEHRDDVGHGYWLTAGQRGEHDALRVKYRALAVHDTVARALTARDRCASAPYPAVTDMYPAGNVPARYRVTDREAKRMGLVPTPAAPLGSPQWHRALVRHLAANLPKPVRDIRTLSCLEIDDWANSAYADGRCPACTETPGWLDFETLEFCPLCCGFLFLPRPVASWYETARCAIEADAESESAWDRRARLLAEMA